MHPPEIEIEPDWEAFHLPFDIGSGRSMFVETPAGPTIRMRFFKRRADGALVGRVWFGAATFGPPGFAHGGILAFVLDEAMGSAAWLAGYPCIAASINVDYLEMTPIGRDCFIEAKVGEVRAKRLALEAALWLDDRPLARAGGVFPRLSRHRMLKMAHELGKEAPDLSGYEFA